MPLSLWSNSLFCLLLLFLSYFIIIIIFCGVVILVPWPGIEPVPLAVKAKYPNHWTAREFPPYCFFFFSSILFLIAAASGKEMSTHSSVLAWKIPGTGEPGGMLSLGSHRLRHDWSDSPTAASVVKNLPASAGDARHLDLIPGSGRSPGVGNGSLPQYSCLENPTDKGAWQATVGVTKSRTQLKRLSICAHTINTLLLLWRKTGN